MGDNHKAIYHLSTCRFSINREIVSITLISMWKLRCGFRENYPTGFYPEDEYYYKMNCVNEKSIFSDVNGLLLGEFSLYIP